MEFNDEEFYLLLDSINHLYGYDLKNYSKTFVQRRLKRFMILKNIFNINELLKVLDNKHEFRLFIENFSINVTEMFRNPSFFKVLREDIITRLKTYPFINIWVAGCASGEEVYSLAIILKEEGLLNKTKIYATDISDKALDIAKQGIYPIEKMKLYTENYQKSGGKNYFSEYYQAKYNSVIFDKSLRENITFYEHNLVTDKSFNEFELILCRNVLIYFNFYLQNKVLDLFHKSLRPLGLLALGNKESINFLDTNKYFNEYIRKEKIFIKIK